MLDRGDDGGLMVSKLASYSDNLSSSHAEVYKFNYEKVVRK